MVSLKSLEPGPVTGDFRLRNASLHETRTGRQYFRIFLEDMSGSLPAYVWDEGYYRGFYLPNHSLVSIKGEGCYNRDQLRITLHTLAPISYKEPGDVIRLIPRTICPLPELLVQLQTAITRLTIDPLRTFVETVFADDSIAFAFVSVPASLNHHHNYPGGLLKHSLECFDLVSRHHDFDPESYQLGLVSALFHDIGKILTLTPDMKRTTLGYSVDHEKLTYEVLKPYFHQLEREWPKGVEELRYLLGWKIRRQVPRYNIADLVACSDRLSAGFDMERKRA